MVFLRASWILFTSHLGGIVRSGRSLVALILVAIPVATAFALSVFLESIDEDKVPEFELGWMLLVQVIVPLVALILGSAVVAEEIEDRTVTYLFTRPIPRPAILFGRWCATVTLLTALLAASAYGVFQITSGMNDATSEYALSSEVRSRFFWVILMGGWVYSAVFAALGALVKRPVILGLGYTFAIEVFLANLPGKNQALTIQYYLKSYLVKNDTELLDRLQGGLVSVELAPPGEALWTLSSILIFALGFGSWILARRQYVLPS